MFHKQKYGVNKMRINFFFFISLFIVFPLHTKSIEDKRNDLLYGNIIIKEKLIENDTINQIKTYNFTSYHNGKPVMGMLCIINNRKEQLYISIKEGDMKNSAMIIPFIKPTLQYVQHFTDIKKLDVINIPLPDSIIIETSRKFAYDNNKNIANIIEREIESSDFTFKINKELKEFGLCINKINTDNIYFISKKDFVRNRKIKENTRMLPSNILQLELFYKISDISHTNR